ncbi:hypothetical protein [Methylobacterium nigriterrae]|uniref:hypothetical protein n=1 Tax=Methylobacterium nigriterrae TaxID=3127512 RepID=UPI003013E9E7
MRKNDETTLAPSPATRGNPVRADERDLVIWTFIALALCATAAWAGVTAWIVWKMLAV